MHTELLHRAAAGSASQAMAPAQASLAETDSGCITAASLLDGQKRVIGHRLAWCTAAGSGAGLTAQHFRPLIRSVAEELAPPSGWQLGPLLLFFDASVDSLFCTELQALPPQNVVLCMSLEDLSDIDARPMLLYLREQGFGFMLRDAQLLPVDPEVRFILTHVDVGAGEGIAPDHLQARAAAQHPPLQLVATRMASWSGFDACARNEVAVFVDGACAGPPVQPGSDTLQPDAKRIVQLMQMIRRNDDLREIEAVLKHDARLTYRLLSHINSPAIGAGVEIHSLRHAVTMLGYSPLFRWLALLFATSNSPSSSPHMTRKAIQRGRFTELLGRELLPAGEADDLFVVGMFSLIDQLLGVSMREVLSTVQLSPALQDAILDRSGPYGALLALAESCESDGLAAGRLAEELLLNPTQVNTAHLSALAWTQNVSSEGQL